MLYLGSEGQSTIIDWEGLHHEFVYERAYCGHGGQLICNNPGMAIKPGSMGKSIPGVDAAILDDEGRILEPYCMGNLAIKTAWPSMMRRIWNNPAKNRTAGRLYASDELKVEQIVRFVKSGLSAHAAPREIEFKDKLPKTRSGKIMRRVLKAWELNLPTGDMSTMED